MLGMILRGGGGSFFSLLTLMIFAGTLLGIPLVIIVLSLLGWPFKKEKKYSWATVPVFSRLDAKVFPPPHSD